MNDPTLLRVWKCRHAYHAQPCWHGQCRACTWATAFDFSEADVRRYYASHTCPNQEQR